MLHIYCGDGKGKTTAAMGAALRALGHGWCVDVLQFLKDGSSGEVGMLADLPGCRVLVVDTSGKFTFQMDEAELARVREEQEENVTRALAEVRAGVVQLVVLDEVLDALTTGTLGEDVLAGLLDACEKTGAEVILTGRNPGKWLLTRADYVTEMRALRHPYAKGTPARKGVEW